MNILTVKRFIMCFDSFGIAALVIHGKVNSVHIIHNIT